MIKEVQKFEIGPQISCTVSVCTFFFSGPFQGFTFYKYGSCLYTGDVKWVLTFRGILLYVIEIYIEEGVS